MINKNPSSYPIALHNSFYSVIDLRNIPDEARVRGRRVGTGGPKSPICRQQLVPNRPKRQLFNKSSRFK